ncbi:MAG: TonB-dependent receptor [Dysgonamonadaceae bacterium]|jgi:TonB-linked SusC/RagA family outer membrane protein|nr:TonB-dependent receptor [Dysgonamonadaceae bacterium]
MAKLQKIFSGHFRPKLFCLIFSCCCALPLFAQNGEKMKGKVVDTKNESLIGVIIQVAGGSKGVVTDADGSFEMDNVVPGTRFVATYIGMTDKPFQFEGKGKELIVVMEEKTNELDEVTIVAFGKQRKESVIASVTTIKPSELRVPSSNLTTALAGRMAGLISYQRTGEPGLDNADFFIRGVTTFGTGKANPLILIDGIEMSSGDLARLTVDDIASFSLMKDANATALYGARGANGVILVTTKEGKEGTVKVQFRAEGSYSAPTSTVELADGVTYMRLHNEAVRTRNPLAELPYSTAKIMNTEKGLDPIRYPNVNWQDMLFDDHTFNQRYNMNISGGGKIARYYIAAAYSNDKGIIRMDKRNNFNSNININKYVLRSNVNINLTKTTEAVVRLHGSFDDYTGPFDNGTDLYKKAMNTSPAYFLPSYPADKSTGLLNHILFGNTNTASNYLNPYAEMLKGYKSEDRSNMLAQFELKQDLSFIAKGLSVRGLFNVNRYSLMRMKYSYEPFFYMLSPYTDTNNRYMLIALNPDEGKDFVESKEDYKEMYNTLYFEGAVQYNREFAGKHNLSGLLVYTMRNHKDGNGTNLQTSLPYRNLGLAGRFTYGYSQRYFLEFNFGYNGSERFAQNERFGFFPSAGVGWIVSNESFMEACNRIISKLKLKATYGLVGNDAIGNVGDRFFYLSRLNMNDSNKGFRFGDPNSPYSRNGISIGRYADPYITWEISHKTNLGFELNLFNDLEVQLDWFRENRYNILQSRSDIPSTMGLQATPSSNIGKANGGGVDFSVDYNKSFTKNFWTTFRGNFTFARSRYDVYEEPDYSDTPWRSHKNQKISQQYGYVAERLFLDEVEVKNSPKQMFGEYGAGDIKYKDINKDGIIDENDQVPIGFPTTPEIIYGFGISAGYKKFDISCFFQGSALSSFWIDAEASAPFINHKSNDNLLNGFTTNRALLQYWADSHWSEDDKNIYALWPRLSSTVNENNLQRSTWFMRDGTFLRLKTVEIGYSLPESWIRQAKVQSARLYATGNNLLVFSKFKMWDPEMAGNGLAYPVQRVINIGINVEF